MTIRMIDGWTVSWDDPEGEVYTKGRFKGRIKRRSRDFRGHGAKGRARATYNRIPADYNPSIKESHWLAL